MFLFAMWLRQCSSYLAFFLQIFIDSLIYTNLRIDLSIFRARSYRIKRFRVRINVHLSYLLFSYYTCFENWINVKDTRDCIFQIVNAALRFHRVRRFERLPQAGTTDARSAFPFRRRSVASLAPCGDDVRRVSVIFLILPYVRDIVRDARSSTCPNVVCSLTNARRVRECECAVTDRVTKWFTRAQLERDSNLKGCRHRRCRCRYHCHSRWQRLTLPSHPPTGTPMIHGWSNMASTDLSFGKWWVREPPNSPWQDPPRGRPVLESVDRRRRRRRRDVARKRSRPDVSIFLSD